MNIEKYLILLRDKDGKFRDRSKDIETYKDYGKIIKVKFYNNENLYTYTKNNFKIFTNPLNIENKIEFNLGNLYNINKILKFDLYYKIFFNDNSTKVTSVKSLQYNSSKNNDNIFDYFKEIANIVSIKTEDGEALLNRAYQKILFVEKWTALYSYLNPSIKPKDKEFNSILIFPFGINQSQYQAVKNAMENQISVIEGPPGTGKTQTILNIIANLIYNGKSVAVVSNNNSATANVFEKLKQFDFDYICATLGRKENKENFIQNQNGLYPNFEYNENDKLEANLNKNKELIEQLEEFFNLQNNIAINKNILSELKIEIEHFIKQENISNLPKIRNIKSLNSQKIMNIKIRLEELKRVGIFLKLKLILLYGIGDFKFYKKSINEIINVYDKIYYTLKEKELNEAIEKDSKRFELLSKNNIIETLKNNSISILRTYLKNKYKNKKERKIFTLEDLNKKSEKFILEYPVIFSTTYSIGKCLNKDFKFDYLIIDEASQVDLITGALALYNAKNTVIVGDRKQLPNVIPTDNLSKIEELSKKYNIASNYDYVKQSFLTSIIESLNYVNKVLLKEHYRCHPKIINFCNKKFYNNELVILTEDKGEEDVMKVYITVKGSHARGHYNQRQIDIIDKEIMPELKQKLSVDEIGIVSPYNEQKIRLQDAINNENIQIDTVHKYQGREKDAIIITTVNNKISEFIDDPKMLNVAITRSKRFLRLVVSRDICEKDGNINDLVKYIKYNNFEVIESNVKSIFDLLYKENRLARLQYLKNKKRISLFDSENIAYNEIENILKNNYNNLGIITHIPLFRILENKNLLNKDELKYASHEWTHIDFVIYNKMDKKPSLAIEVDGYTFHKKSTAQSQRDELKNEILKKYNIPLIRLSTIGSDEKNIIKSKLDELYMQM
ncbi:AAA domain-containing protein [uncultured Brachyspira sp.]|jgi:superfamily I DNA and/or RNA helicase|uniref:AAA domain-containing protein n=1 Tax=uncultured Brachyspira sp. TaxID=221953 RepID=UPI00258538DC|nr:AAA domain-containing protein [uncultured Brachyspira sp.]